MIKFSIFHAENKTSIIFFSDFCFCCNNQFLMVEFKNTKKVFAFLILHHFCFSYKNIEEEGQLCLCKIMYYNKPIIFKNVCNFSLFCRKWTRMRLIFFWKYALFCAILHPLLSESALTKLFYSVFILIYHEVGM